MAENSSDLVVETFKLTKIYQNRQIALNDVTLRLEPGCVLGLLGPNGAGKTTLLRLIIGLHRPTAGWVKVFGKTMTPNAADLRRRIGYIPTNPQFPRGMTPITYLDYMARLFGLPADVRKPRLASLIRAVDLLRVSGDRHRRFLQRHDRPPGRRHQSHQRAGPAHLGRADARPRSRSAAQHAGADQDAGPRKDADRLQPQPQRHRRGVQSRRRAQPRPTDLLRLAAGSQGPDAPQSLTSWTWKASRRRSPRRCRPSSACRNSRSVNMRQRRLELYMHDEAVNTAALANVFMTLADNKVTLVSIRSVGQQTEQAFLDLVEKEESRGFARIYQDEAA